MLGKAMPRVAEPSQVNESSDPGLSGGRREIRRGLPIVAPEIPGGTHGMNQVVGGVDTFKGGAQRLRVQNIPCDHLRRAGYPGAEIFRAPSQTT